MLLLFTWICTWIGSDHGLNVETLPYLIKAFDVFSYLPSSLLSKFICRFLFSDDFLTLLPESLRSTSAHSFYSLLIIWAISSNPYLFPFFLFLFHYPVVPVLFSTSLGILVSSFHFFSFSYFVIEATTFTIWRDCLTRKVLCVLYVWANEYDTSTPKK